MSWGSPNPQARSVPNQDSFGSGPNSTSNRSWGTQDGAPVTRTQSHTANQSSWGAANTSNPPNIPRAQSTPQSTSWGSPKPISPNSANSTTQNRPTAGWGSQPGAHSNVSNRGIVDGAPLPQERGFSDDVLEAGSQAYQAYVDEMRSKQAPSETLKRMLITAQEATDVADYTIMKLEAQNEELKRQQDEMADIHNDLNKSEKKMTSIKSVFGGLATIGSGKSSDQYTKERQKYEHEREKTAYRDEKTQSNEQVKQNKWAQHENKEMIGNTLHNDKKDIHQAKKESRQQVKDVRKGRAELGEGNLVMDGFVFEERIEGAGEECEEELQMRQLHGMTSGLKERAWAASNQVTESRERLENLDKTMEHAQERTQRLNQNMNKYCGKK